MLLSVNVPFPLLRNTPTLLLSVSATTMSVLPIPLRSPVATHMGVWPNLIGTIIGRLNVPSPFPKYSQRVLSPPFATTKSGLPSPLKSPVATAVGMYPAGKEGRSRSPGSAEGENCADGNASNELFAALAAA